MVSPLRPLRPWREANRVYWRAAPERVFAAAEADWNAELAAIFTPGFDRLTAAPRLAGFDPAAVLRGLRYHGAQHRIDAQGAARED